MVTGVSSGVVATSLLAVGAWLGVSSGCTVIETRVDIAETKFVANNISKIINANKIEVRFVGYFSGYWVRIR